MNKPKGGPSFRTGQGSGALVASNRTTEKLRIGLDIVVRTRQASVTQVVPPILPAKILKIGLGRVDRSGQTSVVRAVPRKKALRTCPPWLIRIGQASVARVAPTQDEEDRPAQRGSDRREQPGKQVRFTEPRRPVRFER
jgi:hypothetical protein